MFDIGFWEIALISILALVVIGPERLPKVARTAGHYFGKARRFVEGVKGEVESEFDTAELKRLLHNQEVQLKELQSKIGEEASDFRQGFSYNLEDDIKNEAEDDYLEFLDEDEEKDHEQIAAEKKAKEKPEKEKAEKEKAEQRRKEREFQNPALAENTAVDNTTEQTSSNKTSTGSSGKSTG